MLVVASDVVYTWSGLYFALSKYAD